MADGVDAAVQRLPPPEGDVALDGTRTEAEFEELHSRHDAALSGRKVRDRLGDITRRTFGPNSGPDVRLDRHRPMVAITA